MISGGFGPERAVGQKARDELGVQGVAGLVRHDARLKRPPDQGEVADQVERLVAAEFVGETQRAVQDAFCRRARWRFRAIRRESAPCF